MSDIHIFGGYVTNDSDAEFELSAVGILVQIGEECIFFGCPLLEVPIGDETIVEGSFIFSWFNDIEGKLDYCRKILNVGGLIYNTEPSDLDSYIPDSLVHRVSDFLRVEFSGYEKSFVSKFHNQHIIVHVSSGASGNISLKLERLEKNVSADSVYSGL